MSFTSWGGARPRSSAAALAASIASLLGIASATQPAAAGPRDPIEFQGQLNYDAFRSARALKQGIRVTYSPGGTGAAALALSRVNNVVIDGRCNSACAWAFVRSQTACFTSHASFGFHAAHDPGTGRRLNAATSYWIATARPAIRGRLAGLLETSSLITLSANDMRRYYGDRVCGAKPSEVQVAALKTLKAELARVAAVSIPAPAAPAQAATDATVPADETDIWANAFERAVRFESVTLEAFVAEISKGKVADAAGAPQTSEQSALVPVEDNALPALPGISPADAGGDAPFGGFMLTVSPVNVYETVSNPS